MLGTRFGVPVTLGSGSYWRPTYQSPEILRSSRFTSYYPFQSQTQYRPRSAPHTPELQSASDNLLKKIAFRLTRRDTHSLHMQRRHVRARNVQHTQRVPREPAT